MERPLSFSYAALSGRAQRKKRCGKPFGTQRVDVGTAVPQLQERLHRRYVGSWKPAAPYTAQQPAVAAVGGKLLALPIKACPSLQPEKALGEAVKLRSCCLVPTENTARSRKRGGLSRDTGG